MLKLTLDTSCIIHAAQKQEEESAILDLVDLSLAGVAGLWLSSAFDADQILASLERLRTNMAWLAERPVIRRVPGPFRLDYSRLDGGDVLASEDAARLDDLVQSILLPAEYRAGALQETDQVFMNRWTRKINDVQHLVAHAMASHGVFVTSDHDDILRRRKALRIRQASWFSRPEKPLTLCGAASTRAIRVPRESPNPDDRYAAVRGCG